MRRSETTRAWIESNWPADLPPPQVFFGVPVAPVRWALTLTDEQYARAKAALAWAGQQSEPDDPRLERDRLATRY